MPATDRPTNEDQLGFEPYVKGIEDLIRGAKPSDLPVTIALFGPWGSGKTSFLLQLRERLSGEKSTSPLRTIWFNAWRYDSTQDVRSALIYRILLDLRNAASKTALRKINHALKETATLLAALPRHTAVGLSAGGVSVAFPTSKELIAAVNRAERFQTVVDTFKDAFAEAVKSFLGQSPEQQSKLVVFVDDMDRCLPENVITVLEALKLFLDESRCVFVLGVDRGAVEAAISHRYGSNIGVSARDYLDKIIQYSLSIPSADRTKLADLFGTFQGIDGSNQLESKMLDMAVEGNPRTYYRILSGWQMACQLAPHLGIRPGNEVQRRCLLLATLLQVRFPQLHAVCRMRPDGLVHFIRACRGGESDSRTTLELAAPEYLPFVDDPNSRRFFRELESIGSSRWMNEVAEQLELLRRIFNLTSHVN